jgi:hypothetical protein
MHDKFIIYGPPASGKSTLLRILPTLFENCTSIDLEHVEDKEGRLVMLQHLACLQFKGPLFIGAADIAPKDFPDTFKVVILLYREKSLYLERVVRRNKIRPSKAGQNEDHLFDCFTSVSASKTQWLHIDPACFEEEHELMAKHILEKVGLSPKNEVAF